MNWKQINKSWEREYKAAQDMLKNPISTPKMKQILPQYLENMKKEKKALKKYKKSVEEFYELVLKQASTEKPQ